MVPSFHERGSFGRAPEVPRVLIYGILYTRDEAPVPLTGCRLYSEQCANSAGSGLTAAWPPALTAALYWMYRQRIPVLAEVRMPQPVRLISLLALLIPGFALGQRAGASSA